MKKLLRSIGWATVVEPKVSAQQQVIVEEPKKEVLSESAQKVFNKYPAEVIEIHNKFNNEAEKLLNEAIEASKKIVIDPVIKNKAELASRFGFHRVKEVVETNEAQSKKEEHNRILATINQARVYISDYKWIPEDSVERICKQYGLVFGETSQYKGFLPNQNLLEIEQFSNKHESKLYCVHDSGWGNEYFSTLEQAENYAKLENRSSYSYYRTSNSLNSLMICAPLKDMSTDGYTIEKGYKLEKKAVPDPIILARRDFNGVRGYYIVTAWGDEASDPEVINNNLN